MGQPAEPQISLEGALEAAFGYSLNDLTFAFESATVEAVAQCMISRGWDYDYVMPERFDPTSIERLTAGEQAIVDLEQPGPQNSSAAEDLPPQFNADESDCWQAATEVVPNPVADAWSWLSEQTTDLGSRVSSDGRLVEAKLEEARCIANSGYDPASLNELSNDIASRVQDIVLSFHAGEVDAEKATNQLNELTAEERELWEATDQCIEARLQVEDLIASEFEARWLEENGDRLAAVISEMGDDIDKLQDHLTDVVETP